MSSVKVLVKTDWESCSADPSYADDFCDATISWTPPYQFLLFFLACCCPWMLRKLASCPWSWWWGFARCAFAIELRLSCCFFNCISIFGQEIFKFLQVFLLFWIAGCIPFSKIYGLLLTFSLCFWVKLKYSKGWFHIHFQRRQRLKKIQTACFCAALPHPTSSSTEIYYPLLEYVPVV